MKYVHLFWFPKQDDSSKWLYLTPVFLAISLLLANLNFRYAQGIAFGVFIFPLIVAAIVKIRSAQICPIHQDIISKHAKINLKSRKIIGFIGFFLPLTSLFLVNILPDLFFWLLLGVLSIIAGYLMISAFFCARYFLISSILYIVSYFILAGLCIGSLPVGIILILLLLLLPAPIAEVIQAKRINKGGPEP